MKQAFQCYAYSDGAEWHAICVDLDIAVQGTSFDEVETSLAAAIELYLGVVVELPPEEQSAFLLRRTPLPVRARLAALAWFLGLFGVKQPRAFTFHSHAPAIA